MFSMHLGSGESGGHVVVALRGELDLVEAAAVAAALKIVAAREPRIVVDLAALEFIDASGVAALMRGRQYAHDAGGDLLLAAPRRLVRRVLAIIWEADGFDVHASVAAAASVPWGAAGGAARGAPGAGRPAGPVRHTKMRWQRISVSASAPKRPALTCAWLPRRSRTRCFQPPTYGEISG